MAKHEYGENTIKSLQNASKKAKDWSQWTLPTTGAVLMYNEEFGILIELLSWATDLFQECDAVPIFINRK